MPSERRDQFKSDHPCNKQYYPCHRKLFSRPDIKTFTAILNSFERSCTTVDFDAIAFPAWQKLVGSCIAQPETANTKNTIVIDFIFILSTFFKVWKNPEFLTGTSPATGSVYALYIRYLQGQNIYHPVYIREGRNQVMKNVQQPSTEPGIAFAIKGVSRSHRITHPDNLAGIDVCVQFRGHQRSRRIKVREGYKVN